jgi:RNA polymerase sigma factor (sigma-70 family)
VPVTAVPERLSDADLIVAVRRGDTQAYGLLYERHLAAANRAASYLVTTTSEREDLVAEAFTRVLQVLRAGRGPAHDFRPYLLVTMRHAAINAARRGPSTALFAELPESYLRGATDDPVDARLTGNEAANAFAGLPERWRRVLWHTEVEGESPATIAPMLGMTPNGVAALAYRAREGLRQAYLRLHLPAVDHRDCREATDKLAGWVRGSISTPQRRKISAHLNQCPRCREIAAGLTEVNGELRAASWLSVLKGMLSATAAKVGAAAAVAAVAVGVVASDPASPHDLPHGQAEPAGPGPVWPETSVVEQDVWTGPAEVVAAPQPAGSNVAPAADPPADPPATPPGKAKPEKASNHGSAGGAAPEKPAHPENPGHGGKHAAGPEKPPKPVPPGQQGGKHRRL